VPAILSSLASAAATPAGQRKLANVVVQQPSDVLGNILSGLTGSAPQTTAKGMDILSTLLGGGALGLLTSTLSKFLAVGEAPTCPLMGLLTPLIAGRASSSISQRMGCNWRQHSNIERRGVAMPCSHRSPRQD